MVYDSANKRLAIMGGLTTGSGGYVNDFWTADVTSLFPPVRFHTSLFALLSAS
jgi:hypothetical protein